MTRKQAIAKAARLAKKASEPYFVVFEDGYHVASDYDLDTYFLGCQPILVVDEDGFCHQA